MKRKFGRVLIPDKRDRLYAVPAIRTARTYRYWATPWVGDQGSTSQCVAYAWLGFCHDYPYPHKPPYPFLKPGKLYNLARKMDEWPGEDYEGTSVRGGIKALLSLGSAFSFTVEYRWAFNIAQVISTILELGPMVVGTEWTARMMDPDGKGRIIPDGESLGGHAYVLCGVNTRTSMFRIQNSWGKSWGDGGKAWISIADFERLLGRDGEACIALERDV